MSQFPTGRDIVTPIVNSSGIYTLVTNTPLTGNQVFISNSYKRLGDVAVDSLNFFIYADQPGTHYLEESDDNATWSTTATMVPIAGTLNEFGWTKVTKRYHRSRYVNGSGNQTDFSIYKLARTYGDINSPTGTGNVLIAGSNIMLPVDIQGHLSQTIQTHNAVSVASSGNATQTSWMDCNGYTDISLTLQNDATALCLASISWSNDGVNTHGQDSGVIPLSSKNFGAGSTKVKARYAKVIIGNNDSIAHTMSAWAYLMS
jgi:hypothetical protein